MLRLAMDAAQLGVWAWQPEGERITWMNERTCEILGISPAAEPAATDHCAEKIIRPEDLALFRRAIAATVQTGARLLHQCRFRRLDDGTLRWAEFTGRSAQELQGPSVGVIGTVCDITERKQAEEALRESQRFFRASLNALSGRIAVLNEAGVIVEINEAWQRFARESQPPGMSVNVASALGVGVNYLQKCMQALAPGSAQPDYVRGISNVIAGWHSSFQMEYPCHSPTQQRWFFMRVTRFRGPGPVRVIIVHDDCTERKLAEKALRHSEQRFRALFDRGPVAMYSCDTSGVIQEFNPCAVKLWGRTPRHNDVDERFCGVAKVYRPDGQLLPASQNPMIAVLKGDVPQVNDAEAIIERPDGSRITVITNVVPLKNSRGEITGAINCFYDITERSRLERKTQEQARALADLHHRKDEFLAMLSHELRNPLAPLTSAVQLLGLQKDEDPVQHQARCIIERQVGQLKHLVDDLLEISRITSGSVRLRLERVSVERVVAQAVETAQPLIAQRRHHLTVTQPPQPLWLHADPTRLEQVLVNLLANAAKYTDEGGHIWLSVEQAAPSPGAAHGMAVLRVRDNGIGIARELLPYIFDLFSQAERSLDRSEGGLGIGLCLVQRLVELHKGGVRVHSVFGQGSEFVVRLPLMRADELATSPPPAVQPAQIAQAQAVPAAPPVKKGCRVLAVDDNKDVVQSMAMLLELSGHEVQIACDGPSAIKAALARRPDVVLLDIGLPGLTGYEVAQRMRQEPSLRNVVLVALTGYGREADRQRSKKAGFDYHLVKPADFREVEAIVAHAAQRAARTAGPPQGDNPLP